jgi:multiple sugar transport system permease protein
MWSGATRRSSAFGSAAEGSRWDDIVRQQRVGYLFIAPFVIGILVFSVYPLVYNVVLSLTDRGFVQSGEFVGLENFVRLFHDPRFYKALRTTVLFALFATASLIVIPLMLALLVNDKHPGKFVFRTLYFLPIIMSGPAIAVIFIFIYDRDFGLLNQALGLLGKVAWIGDERYAVPSMVLLAAWHQTPINFILYLAALQDVPRDLVEASIIDGANPFQQFFRVILPTITPTVFLTLVTTTTFQMKQFAYPAILNEGRFGTATLAYEIYDTAFKIGKFGYSSAMALTFALVIFAIMIAQWSLQSKWVNYENA